jgi:hypothetical protein
MGDELAALGMADRGCNGDFDAELVRPMSFALADAFDVFLRCGPPCWVRLIAL